MTRLAAVLLLAAFAAGSVASGVTPADAGPLRPCPSNASNC